MSAEQVERDHRDGCMTEYTWDEDDCNCRVCTICAQPVRADGHCRWAPKGHATTTDGAS